MDPTIRLGEGLLLAPDRSMVPARFDPPLQEAQPIMSTPTSFSPAQEAFVAAYMSERRGQDKPLDRVVAEPSGLSPEEMMSVLTHPGHIETQVMP